MYSHDLLVFTDRFHVTFWQKSQGFLLQVHWSSLVAADNAADSVNSNKEYCSIVATFNNEPAMLTGFAVVSNPLLGHVCLYRSHDSTCGVANVTVRSRVAEMHKRLIQIADRFSDAESERNEWVQDTSLLKVVEDLADRAYEGIAVTPRPPKDSMMVRNCNIARRVD